VAPLAIAIFYALVPVLEFGRPRVRRADRERSRIACSLDTCSPAFLCDGRGAGSASGERAERRSLEDVAPPLSSAEGDSDVAGMPFTLPAIHYRVTFLEL